MMPIAFLRNPGRSMISSLVTAWTTGSASIGARGTLSMLTDIAARALPAGCSTAASVDVADPGASTTGPFVGCHSILARRLHFADPQRVDTARHHQLSRR